MEKEFLGLLRYPRKKIHKHEKTKNMKPLRQMQALCDELDSDNLHVVADSLDSLMFRMSQEQPVMDPHAAMLNAAKMNQLQERLENLGVEQTNIQNQMQSLKPDDMQQRLALNSRLKQIMDEFAQVQAEMQNLQRVGG